MSVETTRMNTAIQQIKTIHEAKQHRFVYVKENNANKEVLSFYGTNWRILAAWHRFKYTIQSCCHSNIIIIGGSTETERAKEMLESEIVRQVNTIVTYINSETDERTVKAYREATEERYGIPTDGRQMTYLGCLPQDIRWNIRDALGNKERHFRRMEARNSLTLETQTKLNDIQNGSNSLEVRLGLIRTFLPTLAGSPDKTICMVELKVALRSIFEQMSKDPSLNSMDLETAKKQFTEIQNWYSLYASDEYDPQFRDSFYSVIGQYAMHSDPLMKQLEEEATRLIEQENKAKEELSKLKTKIDPLNEQVSKCRQAYWNLTEQLDLLEKEYYAAEKELSEPINAYKKAKALTESLPGEIKFAYESIHRSNNRCATLPLGDSKSEEERFQRQLYTQIERNKAKLTEALKDINDPEKATLRATNERILAERTKPFEVEKQSLHDALKKEDENIRRIVNETNPHFDNRTKIESRKYKISQQKVKVQTLLNSIKAKESNDRIGRNFLDLYIWNH